jgi:hypothetical protein
MLDIIVTNRHRRTVWLGAVLGLAFACLAMAQPSAGDDAVVDLKPYASTHYVIHTDLPKREARVFGKHMDRVFETYHQKFSNIGLAQRDNTPMPLYLLRTREQYVAFMAQYDINAANTGGMFFVQRQIHGLATFARDRPVTETFAILQHEGFHQFAFQYVGTELPIWVNEGLAQYFEDGIFVQDELQLNLANARRIEAVKAALQAGRTMSFDRMLSMTNTQWAATLESDPEMATLLYDQAWSMVFFLATADRGRYVRPFRQYLHDVANRRDSLEAFHNAYRMQDTEPFERAWRRWAAEAQPDTVNIVLERLNFLGHALQFLKEHDMPMPRTTSQLRSSLQQLQYRAIRTSHGLTTEISAMDEAMYRYPVDGPRPLMFQMLAPARDDLPPRLSAPGLDPTPMLIWSRDDHGKLIQDLVFQ